MLAATLATATATHVLVCRIQMSHKDRKVRMASSVTPLARPSLGALLYCKNTQQGRKVGGDEVAAWAAGTGPNNSCLGSQARPGLQRRENLIEVTQQLGRGCPAEKCHWSWPITIARWVWISPPPKTKPDTKPWMNGASPCPPGLFFCSPHFPVRLSVWAE